MSRATWSAANTTGNQHFVSQVEQRLNATNPDVEEDLQRIFVFDVSPHNREPTRLSPKRQRGAKIKHNLSCLDLFSFNVDDARVYRENLEHVFKSYEDKIRPCAESLLRKCAAGGVHDLKHEIIDLFAAKLMNLLRNPHSCQQALNTIGAAADVEPTAPEVKRVYELVRAGSRPHAREILRQFKISAPDYERWLRALLVVFGAARQEDSLFAMVIKALFETNAVAVHVYHYSSDDPADVCLLSDRACNVLAKTDGQFGMEFNISSRAFAVFLFSDMREYNVPDSWRVAARSSIEVHHTADDLAALALYNQRTVFQCARTVFAARPSPRMQAP